MASMLDSIQLDGVTSNHQAMQLRQLPPNLQLSSLVFTDMDVQLQPAAGFSGVVQPRVPLKQLQLSRCLLLDGVEGLAAALYLLPGLQHLSISLRQWCFDLSALAHHGAFSTDALSGLQQLTYLELAELDMQGPDQGVPVLQPLQGLTCLADLRLCLKEPTAVESSIKCGCAATHLPAAVRACQARPWGPGRPHAAAASAAGATKHNLRCSRCCAVAVRAAAAAAVDTPGFELLCDG
jgi:hypothetical protein